MAIPVEMPKMSDTMEEGVLVSWQAEEGAQVSAGDVIAEVETDKATMDLEVYDDGVLLKKVVGEGESVPIGGLIAVLGEEGEDISDILDQYGQRGAGDGREARGSETEDKGEDEEAQAVEETGQPAPRRTEPVASEGAIEDRSSERRPTPGGDGAQKQTAAPATRAGDGKIKSSPLARRLARDHGIELAALSGSGPEGRIIKRDVEAAIEGEVTVEAPAPSFQVREETYEAPVEALKISQMRKTIARRLAESKFTAPHFYLTVDIDMERCIAARTHINGAADARGEPKISFNDLVTKACALALRKHPQVNASYLEKEGEIRKYNEVHVAVAVAIDEGLVTPVIRHADRKGLLQIATETRELADRARKRKLQPEDWEGSTFTTSNLGMYGIEEFTAIINPPNSCILAIGAIRDVPVVKDGAVVPGQRMKVTLSCDHRLVDGATGSEFLTTVQQYLEEPLAMLL